MVELFDAPEALFGSLNIQDCGEVVCKHKIMMIIKRDDDINRGIFPP